MRHALLLFILLVSATNINGQALPDTVSYENIKIKPGDFVPDFSAQDENSKIKKLSDLHGKKNLILIFFRGYWWPHCRRQLANLSNFKFPKDVKIQVEKQTVIKINGVDKELVSKIASDIKSLKPVEPYKGKGIKERNQYVLRKEGKKK